MTSLKEFALVPLAGCFALALTPGFALASNSRQCSLSHPDPALRCPTPEVQASNAYIQSAPPKTLSGEAPIEPKARLKRYCAELKITGKEDADSLCRQLQPGQ